MRPTQPDSDDQRFSENPRILHLEDNDHDAELIREFLDVDGLACVITRAKSGEEFVLAIESGSYDAILSDYTIPGVGGMKALQIAQAKLPDVPFIFVSGTIGEEVAVESLVSGATDYVLKERPARLPTALRRALKESAARRDQLEHRRYEEFQAELLRNVNDALLAVDDSLCIQYWNEPAARFFSFPSEIPPGSKLDELGLADVADLVRLVAGNSSDAAALSIEISRVDTEGAQVWGLAQVSEIRQGDNRRVGHLIVIRDITERKQYLQMLLTLNSELETMVSERTADLTTANRELRSFGYSVSHDLQAPLRAIRGYVEILMDEHSAEMSDEARHMLHRAAAAGRRMTQLIDGLMILSKLTQTDVRVRPVEISKLAAEVSADLMDAHRDRNVQWQIQPNLVAQADPSLIRSVMENLFGNALKFTIARNPAVIEFGAVDYGDETTYHVRDNGIGFDSSAAPAIFEVFTRLHRDDEYPGTGVGLATVDRIIRRHGGRVWANSQPGQGATILFTLAGRS